MAVISSILNSTKKILGLDENNDAFDLDIITHINSCFFTLNQLGVGPPGGFMIEDDSVEWADYLNADLNMNAVKSYVYLRVRLLFDPPDTPHHIKALEDQRVELEHRLKTEGVLRTWTQPSSSPSLP